MPNAQWTADVPPEHMCKRLKTLVRTSAAHFFIKEWGGQNQEVGREFDGHTWYDVPKSRLR